MNKPTSRDDSPCDIEVFYSTPGIRPPFLVISLNLWTRCIRRVITTCSKGVHFLEEYVVYVQSALPLVSVRSDWLPVNLLHVKKRVEKRVNKPCRHLHKLWKLRLQRVIDVIVFTGRYFEILLELIIFQSVIKGKVLDNITPSLWTGFSRHSGSFLFYL